jgi:hypothetical protein
MADYVVATENLYLPNSITLAHLKGDQVPKENVEPNGWSDSVASPSSKAAKSVTE